MAYDYRNQNPLEGACCAPCAAGGRCAGLGAFDKSGKPLGLKSQTLASGTRIMPGVLPAPRSARPYALYAVAALAGVGLVAVIARRRRRR